MPIQILSPQLVNQIAAGEVVERPASVVKELVENSLDAGATRIDIKVERGGAKTIRIRDNGSGISKEELALAIARHATSKISSMEDLDCITSMGFRGEALASVSSVARLTITSRTTGQNEAWQAYAEKYDKTVTIKPAAHPIGTTVEVVDLFYNTPARRKFMRAETTEFKHIEEVIRRIALARFDVTFILQHNDKTVQQYRAVIEPSKYSQRLSRLCGTAFVKRALAVSWQHSDLTIQGWAEDPRGEDLPEMQYSYVNQRMIRDKLINHAIRQAYQEQLVGMRQPAFVIFIVINPKQVDINVHPAKKEVRFHQARQVHHLIYQAVITVLQHNLPVRSARQQGVKTAQPHVILLSKENKSVNYSACAKDSNELKLQEVPPLAAQTCYDPYSFGRVLTFCSPSYALLESANGLSLLSLPFAERYLTERQLMPEDNTLLAQPLLIPLRMILRPCEAAALHHHRIFLQNMGILLQSNEHQAILNAVPLQLLRKKNLQNLIPELLGYLSSEASVTYHKVAAWLARRINDEVTIWSYSRAIPLIAEIERLCPHWVNKPPNGLMVTLNIETAIKALNYD
ncbi:DNA mismatch repair endonuclease MutL [Candidatus Palibaumannia cicadellinicola]|uniref:DNA mismatch repair protein MutL n=1 Tax=Candidatus Palibaumannia cicadellinicola TaxID=186490 RepID=A0A088MZ60_9GAMM|nr:DNA mismatch repair endonuclease MutL [Candidatus Baumannia cicadellinicola]AIN47504.1 DNA mismatch repair protein MutL [Candidatus Baumannia cicadellinicola]